jgi:hypothetical protein
MHHDFARAPLASSHKRARWKQLATALRAPPSSFSHRRARALQVIEPTLPSPTLPRVVSENMEATQGSSESSAHFLPCSRHVSGRASLVNPGELGSRDGHLVEQLESPARSTWDRRASRACRCRGIRAWPRGARYHTHVARDREALARAASSAGHGVPRAGRARPSGGRVASSWRRQRFFRDVRRRGATLARGRHPPYGGGLGLAASGLRRSLRQRR